MRAQVGRRSLLDAAQTVALVVAIAAGLAATFDPRPARILVLGFVAVGCIGWRHPPIRVGLAVVAVLVVVADALGNRPVDARWIRVALAALVLAGVCATRASLLGLRPLADDDRTARSVARSSAVVIPAIVLTLLLLVGFAVGPDVRLGDETRTAGSQIDPGSSRIEPPGSGGNEELAPYLGFQQTLDTASRGELGDAVVLRVEADAPDFWRGQSFDRWDGREWSRSEAAPVVTVDAVRDAPAGVAAASDVPLVPFDQRFRVEAPAIGELFAAYKPLVIGLPPRTYTYGLDGSVELLAPLGRGSEYTVTSLRAQVTPEILRDHDPRTGGGPEPRSEMQGPVSDRVARLARRVTADAPTTYDAVRAIERWMAARTTYTTDIPPLPAGADAVEQHLFVDRKGFCVQIATSTAAMLHAIGVPVRLGVGFVPGEPSLLGRSFTVREKDAHAWVEVWFPGVGWQAFDPTADVPLAGEYDQSWLAQVLRVLRRLLGPILVVVALGGAVLVWWLLRRRRRRAVPAWSVDLLRRIERAGRARGRPRTAAETPRAYLEALAAEVIPAPEPLAEVAAALDAAAYGPRPPDADARARAEAAWAAALEAAGPPRRRRPDPAPRPREPAGV